VNHPGDLHVPFLNKVLEKVREAAPVDGDEATCWTFYEFVPPTQRNDERRTKLFVQRHLEYLQQIGLLELGFKNGPGEYLSVQLTAEGRHYVQPELAQFYGDVLAQLVPEIEAQIDRSALPEDEKETIKYKFKEALAAHAPDLAVRLMVEILAKVAGR
jgi:hypothetical protein